MMHRPFYLTRYLLTLTFFFLVFECSFFLNSQEDYLGAIQLVARHLTLPAVIWPGVILFCCAQLFLHGLLVLWIVLSARWIGNLLRLSAQKTEILGLWMWFLAIIAIMLANQIFFPNSRFANLIHSLLATIVAKSCLCAIGGLLVLLTGLAVFSWARNNKVLALLLGSILFWAYFPWRVSLLPSTVLHASHPTKPNIIIIGLDAVRPDFLEFFQGAVKTPHLSHFLQNAFVFQEALTPIARTFPAWLAILSGRYPRETGARFDLADSQSIHLGDTLPIQLHALGYRTLYATDETRFSNIDQSFGFDQILGPPMGANDFLLGTLNDFPLSNLVVNTPLGRILFPYSYGNRAAFVTYRPQSFLNLMRPLLAKVSDKPLFLAVHFCLPHYPYLWARHLYHPKHILKDYQASITAVDRQFQDFLQLLSQYHFLDHSLVILLSDHGEALELSGDRVTDKRLFVFNKNSPRKVPKFYPPSADWEDFNQSSGHGTDVLSLSQYHSLLAMRVYGSSVAPGKRIQERATLLDIKATILDWLGIKNITSSGISFKTFLLQKKSFSIPRDFFMESDYSPESVRTIYPEMRKILFEGIKCYHIHPKTARITVKEDMGKMILRSKQYADLYTHWILALYPQKSRKMMPILINLKTGQWTNDLKTHFSEASPARHMLQALRKFYGDELYF